MDSLIKFSAFEIVQYLQELNIGNMCRYELFLSFCFATNEEQCDTSSDAADG